MSARRTTSTPVGNLPAEVTSFVGRAGQLKLARRVLAESRLVTLVGVGGVGKTRFALRLAADVAHVFADGAWLVELENLPATADSATLAQTIALALGVTDFSAQQPVRALIDHLAGQHCLLIMDNCEHLIEQVGRLVSHLLRSANRLHILATSRRTLGCAGEHVLPVAPLSLPDVSSPPAGEALELFRQRASALSEPIDESDVDAAMEICRRLDGLPLAIELAVGRLISLSAVEVLDRLEGGLRLLAAGTQSRPSPRQTLEHVMEWSYHLCTERERSLWERASVFVDGFDLPAAEAVCAGDDIDPHDVLDILTELTRQSLLTVDRSHGPTRYRQLETLRQYGADQLARRGQTADLRQRHREFYQRMASEAARDWLGPHEVRRLHRTSAEMPNLRAAMEFALAEHEPLSALDIAINLTRLRTWFFVGWPGEGRTWLERARRRISDQPELTRDTRDTREMALVATAFTGWLALCQGEPEVAEECLRECQSAPDSADPFGAVGFLSAVYAFLAKSEPTSVAMFTDVLMDMEKGGLADSDMAMAETMRALAASFYADTADALAITRRHLDRSLRHGVEWQTSWARWAVALAQSRDGDHRGALHVARESLRAQRDYGDRWGMVWGTHVVAWVMAGDLRAASSRGERPDPAAAEAVAHILGGAEQLRRWTGVELAGLGPFSSETERAARTAEAILGRPKYMIAVERENHADVPRSTAFERIIGRALGDGRDMPPTTPVASSTTESLTAREGEIAALVARGRTNTQIAERLVISIRTVQTHVGNILRKLGMHNRQELAAWYLQEHPTPTATDG